MVRRLARSPGPGAALRGALFLSGCVAHRLIAERLPGIDLSGITEILLSACKEVAVIWGGSILLGGLAGGVVGFFGFGIGTVPGAGVGAGVGTQLGAWALGILGLKALIEDLGTAIPKALRHYELGFKPAWGPVRRWEHDQGADRAPHELAEGHIVLTVAMLSALTAYLTRGRGDPAARARILAEISQSPKLGPKVADWVTANEDKLIRHPALQPEGRQVGIASQAKPPDNSPLTPSQVRQGARKNETPAPATKQPPPPSTEKSLPPVAQRPFTDRSIFATYPQKTSLQFGSIHEQAGFLAANVPGLSPPQAPSILEAGISRSSSVVFGGSRVRGNFTEASDLDVGFGNLSERPQRVIGSINNQGHGLTLERLTIVPGNRRRPSTRSPARRSSSKGPVSVLEAICAPDSRSHLPGRSPRRRMAALS